MESYPNPWNLVLTPGKLVWTLELSSDSWKVKPSPLEQFWSLKVNTLPLEHNSDPWKVRNLATGAQFWLLESYPDPWNTVLTTWKLNPCHWNTVLTPGKLPLSLEHSSGPWNVKPSLLECHHNSWKRDFSSVSWNVVAAPASGIQQVWSGTRNSVTTSADLAWNPWQYYHLTRSVLAPIAVLPLQQGWPGTRRSIATSALPEINRCHSALHSGLQLSSPEWSKTYSSVMNWWFGIIRMGLGVSCCLSRDRGRGQR